VPLSSGNAVELLEVRKGWFSIPTDPHGLNGPKRQGCQNGRPCSSRPWE